MSDAVWLSNELRSNCVLRQLPKGAHVLKDPAILLPLSFSKSRVPKRRGHKYVLYDRIGKHYPPVQYEPDKVLVVSALCHHPVCVNEMRVLPHYDFDFNLLPECECVGSILDRSRYRIDSVDSLRYKTKESFETSLAQWLYALGSEEANFQVACSYVFVKAKPNGDCYLPCLPTGLRSGGRGIYLLGLPIDEYQSVALLGASHLIEKTWDASHEYSIYVRSLTGK